MLCPAAVSAAAAAAVWLLAALGPVLSLPAEHNSEADFSLCSHCFYRQTPPQGASAGLPLHPLCHRLPAGQTFATLSKPTCDTAVYSAFHLSYRGEVREVEEEGEPEEEDGNTKTAVPALLRGEGDLAESDSLAESPLQLWDSTITTLVRSTLTPQCNTLEGELYILTGAGGLNAAKDGGEECQTQPLWSAVCCAAPEGKSSFSVGLIKETEEEERQVSVKELEEILGGAELFSEGCGGADGEAAGIITGLFSQAVPETVEEVNVDPTGENTGAEDVESNTAGQSTEEEEVASDTINYESNSEESSEAQTAEEEEAASDPVSRVLHEDVQSFRETETAREEEDGSDTASQASDEHSEENREIQRAEEYVAAVDDQREEDETSESSSNEQRSVTRSRSDESESTESSAGDETVEEQQTETNSSSTLVYILSTTLYIMKAPLQPVFSTITQLPGQVMYVLQEDLGVLSALPGDTLSLLHLLTSDILSGLGSVADMLYGIGETCFSNIYCCTSSMLGALYTSCHTGVTGVGTLAGDTVGVFNGVLDKTWWVTKFFGGRLWRQSEGYVGTVVSEMGGQAKAVGGGVGRLAWRSGNGAGNVFRLGWGFIRGTVGVIIGALRGAFGEESE